MELSVMFACLDS